jgi:hypothetical protein
VISRRRFWNAVLAGLSIPLFPGVGRAARPFCRFSLGNGWSDVGPSQYITRRARRNDPSGVPQVIRRILAALSVRAEVDVLIAEEEDNAFATVANGRRIVVADVHFLEKLNALTGTQWSAIQVLAHELGHHIAGFVADSHRGELNADYWSGQALQRLGAARAAAMAAILTVGTDSDTPTHPAKHRRASMIARGWDDAARGTIDYSLCDSCR